MIDIVRGIRDRGVSILIIEHVMRAIMSLSDRIVVLNVGSKLAEGPPWLVANDPAVIAAYLGDATFMNGAEYDPMTETALLQPSVWRRATTTSRCCGASR